MRYLKYLVFIVGSYGSACGIFTERRFRSACHRWDRFMQALTNAPPVCRVRLFYPDYPYGCAPYGYYGPGLFRERRVHRRAGPWANPYYSHAAFYRPYYFNRGAGVGERFRGSATVLIASTRAGSRTFGSERAYRDDYRGYRGGDSYRGNGYRGGDSYRGNGYRGGDSYRGGGSYGNGRELQQHFITQGGDRDHGGGSYNSGSHG